MSNSNPPVTASAAAHAERLRARDEEKAKAPRGPVDSRSTAERYAERALAGVRADQALRRQAEENDRRARGESVPGDQLEDAEEYDDVEDIEEEADVEEEEEAPVSTAERYAQRERERQKAEHAATLAAHRSAGQMAPPPQGHRYAAQLAQQYRRTTQWPNPAA